MACTDYDFASPTYCAKLSGEGGAPSAPFSKMLQVQCRGAVRWLSAHYETSRRYGEQVASACNDADATACCAVPERQLSGNAA